jgi:hypothetical protein
MGATERLANGRFPPGNGAGWGGPAQGPGNGKERKLSGPGPGRAQYSQAGEARLERQARHAELMKQVLFDLALDSEKDEVRMNASAKLLDRIEGLPVQRILNAETDPISMMDKGQIDAEIAMTEAKAAKLAELRREDEARSQSQAEQHVDSRTETPNES